MYNSLCQWLNLTPLAPLSRISRLFFAKILPTQEKEYGGSCGGYQSWIESPIGVLAFRTDAGDLEWEW